MAQQQREHERRPRGRPARRYAADAEPQVGDEVCGEWRYSQLEAMNDRFARAVMRELEAQTDANDRRRNKT